MTSSSSATPYAAEHDGPAVDLFLVRVHGVRQRQPVSSMVALRAQQNDRYMQARRRTRDEAGLDARVLEAAAGREDDAPRIARKADRREHARAVRTACSLLSAVASGGQGGGSQGGEERIAELFATTTNAARRRAGVAQQAAE